MVMVEKTLVIRESIRLLVQNYFVLTVKKRKKREFLMFRNSLVC